MHAYVLALQEYFLRHADPASALPMKAYMRDQFDFLGIKTPQRRDLMKRFLEKHGLPALDEITALSRDLWNLPEREFQYINLGLLERLEKQLPETIIETYESLIVNKSWWDTVDGLAGTLVGAYFKRFPELRDAWISRWRSSENFWLRRTTLLFQLGYKKSTDFPLLCDLILENLGSKEFFINKAIGWALREYSKTDPQAVRDFVSRTPLEPLSAREALKWLQRKTV